MKILRTPLGIWTFQSSRVQKFLLWVLACLHTSLKNFTCSFNLGSVFDDTIKSSDLQAAFESQFQRFFKWRKRSSEVARGAASPASVEPQRYFMAKKSQLSPLSSHYVYLLTYFALPLSTHTCTNTHRESYTPCQAKGSTALFVSCRSGGKKLQIYPKHTLSSLGKLTSLK